MLRENSISIFYDIQLHELMLWNFYFYKKTQMKITFLSLLSVSILFACTDSEKKTMVKADNKIASEKVEAKKKIKTSNSIIAQIEADAIIPVQFLVSGKLEKGDISLKEGATFKKNQLLFRVNSEAYYYELVAEKEELTRRLFAVIAQVEVAAPSERQKWIDFLKAISDVELVPEFPSINDLKEKIIVSDNKLDQQYNKIRKMEKNMSHYFMLAPFNGTISSLKTNIGGFIKKGQELCVLSSNQFHISSQIAASELERFSTTKEYSIKSMSGTTIGKANFQFSRPVHSTDSVSVHFSIQQLDKPFKINNLSVQLEPIVN